MGELNKFSTGVISTGSKILDEFLVSGYEKDVITTIYGPAGSGKTNLVLIALVDQIKKGRSVIYIDTEGSFSVTRVMQLCPDFEKFAEKVLFLKPTTFTEQKAAFEKLKEAVNEKDDIGLIIIDSIAMLYRLEVGKSQDVYNVNKELGIQLGLLTGIARKKLIPVLITNQVYADFDNKDAVKMVGGDLLKYSSKCLIELKKASHSVRVAQLRKHRSIKEGKEVPFLIKESGLVKADISDSPIDTDEVI
jgi:DNA repair protein RadB